MAHGTGGGVVDGKRAEVAALGSDAPLAQHLDQITGGATHVEGRRHREIAPQQPTGDVGVGGHPVVAGITRQALAIAFGVPALAEVGPAVGIGHSSATCLGRCGGPSGRIGQFSPDPGHCGSDPVVAGGQVDQSLAR